MLPKKFLGNFSFFQVAKPENGQTLINAFGAMGSPVGHSIHLSERADAPGDL